MPCRWSPWAAGREYILRRRRVLLMSADPLDEATVMPTRVSDRRAKGGPVRLRMMIASKWRVLQRSKVHERRSSISTASALPAIDASSAGILVPTGTGLHARARSNLVPGRAVLRLGLRGRSAEERRG
jgi:hypothetical protein